MRILFTYPYLSTFIQSDLNILQKYFDVKTVGSFRRNILKFLRGIAWADLTYCWFADFSAFVAVLLSKILRKKVVVVLGGFEVAKIPEIRYGLLLSSLFSFMVRFTLKGADVVLAVEEGLKRDAIKNVGMGDNIQVLHLGYDPELFKPGGKKNKLVITAAQGDSWRRILVKGIDVFVEAAKYMPEVKFVVIGVHGEALEKLRSLAPSNASFTGFIPQEELISYYQRASVYCQLSMREGFSSALCEAMLCECVPVGTERGGIPTVIGGEGFYVPYGDSKATADAIRKALKSKKGRNARKGIEKLFPLKKREERLVSIITDLYQAQIAPKSSIEL